MKGLSASFIIIFVGISHPNQTPTLSPSYHSSARRNPKTPNPINPTSLFSLSRLHSTTTSVLASDHCGCVKLQQLCASPSSSSSCSWQPNERLVAAHCFVDERPPESYRWRRASIAQPRRSSPSLPCFVFVPAQVEQWSHRRFRGVPTRFPANFVVLHEFDTRSIFGTLETNDPPKNMERYNKKWFIGRKKIFTKKSFENWTLFFGDDELSIRWVVPW
ncbi:uncharacterized protein LOC125492873 [Beta vulgaris subsp. vulgaris]|uniref:uncharacterized protein LOC125492873 n=1 Tax=Beta vulgaris subsp. vulgaris TaxID=3555 RepID=UPI002036F88D|nr:uncharacterized protein LOC125492873 [Beta vulgaris subsp. vulgaris]